MEKKTIIKASLVIILIILLSSLLYLLIWTPSEKAHWITIYGKVYADEETMKTFKTDNKSYYERKPILIFVNEYNPARSPIPDGDRLALSSIDWKEEVGNYSISFELPAPMKVVVLANCANYTVLTLTKEINQIKSDVYWGLNCLPQTEISVSLEPDKERINVNRDITHVQSLLNNYKPKEDEIGLINFDINEANQLRDYSYDSRDVINESLKNAYQAHWFILRAEYRIRLSELKKCIDDGKYILSKFDPLYFKPSYEIKEKMNSSANTFLYRNQTSILRTAPYGKENKELVLDIKWLDRENNDIDDDITDCKKNFALLNETFTYQTQYYNQRRGFLTLLVLIAFILGLLIESHFKIINKAFEKYSDVKKHADHYISKIFLKKQEITTTNINIILTSGVFISILDFFIIWFQKLTIYLIASWISFVLIILGSIFGLLSLGYNTEKLRHASWLLYIFSMAVLLLIPAYFGGLIFLSSVGSKVYEIISTIIPKTPTL